MKKGIAIMILAWVLAGAVYSACMADTSFRCGNHIVDNGDTMYAVRQMCGAPDAAERIGERTIYAVIPGQRLKIKDELYLIEWIYKKHGGLYVLTFEGNRLIEKTYIK